MGANESRVSIVNEFRPADNTHVWTDRYKHLLMDVMKDYDKMDAVQKENIDYIINEHRFILPKTFTMVKAVDCKPVVIGYKIVNIMHDDIEKWIYNSRLYTHTIALLELNVIGKILYGATGKPVDSMGDVGFQDELCSDSVITTGVQFIGSLKHNREIADFMDQGRLSLVSVFNKKFAYKIGYNNYEPECGKPGIGCVQGIHFHISKKHAIEYLKMGFGGINLFRSIMTEQVRETEIESKMDIEMYTENIEHGHDEPCSVCLNDIWVNDNPMVTKCGHVFHHNCLQEWNLINNSCPICRKELTEKF